MFSDEAAERLAGVIKDAVECTPYWRQDDPSTHQDPYANAARAVIATGDRMNREQVAAIIEEHSGWSWIKGEGSRCYCGQQLPEGGLHIAKHQAAMLGLEQLKRGEE